MDKKSNRTDLLAAGRKKLQQYRQKKDNKGKDGKGKDGKSSGRSSSSADQSEQNDADVNLVSDGDTMKAQSSQLSGKEAETSANSVDINIYSQKPVGDSEGTSVDTTSPVDLSSSELVSAETSSAHESDLNTLTIGGQVEIGAREFEGSGTSGPPTEFNALNVDILSSSAYFAPEAASDSIVAADSVEVKGLLEGDQGQFRRLTIMIRSILLQKLSASRELMKPHLCPMPAVKNLILRTLTQSSLFLLLQSVGLLKIMNRLRLLFLLRQTYWVLKQEVPRS